MLGRLFNNGSYPETHNAVSASAARLGRGVATGSRRHNQIEKLDCNWLTLMSSEEP